MWWTPPGRPSPRSTAARRAYNIVDDDPATVAEWLPLLAEVLGGKPPRRVPAFVARLAAGLTRCVR
jgi:hypothetical protein